jgi:hypothetical protein
MYTDDVIYPYYDSVLRPILTHPAPEPQHALSSSAYSPEPAVQVPEVPEGPGNRDPCSTPSPSPPPHPHLLADPPGGYLRRGDCPSLGSTESSGVTTETSLSSDYEDLENLLGSSSTSVLQRLETMHDLRDLYPQLDGMLRERSALLDEVYSILCTLAGDAYLLGQAKRFVEDLIDDLIDDQTPSAL